MGKSFVMITAGKLPISSPKGLECKFWAPSMVSQKILLANTTSYPSISLYPISLKPPNMGDTLEMKPNFPASLVVARGHVAKFRALICKQKFMWQLQGTFRELMQALCFSFFPPSSFLLAGMWTCWVELQQPHDDLRTADVVEHESRRVGVPDMVALSTSLGFPNSGLCERDGETHFSSKHCYFVTLILVGKSHLTYLLYPSSNCHRAPSSLWGEQYFLEESFGAI